MTADQRSPFDADTPEAGAQFAVTGGKFAEMTKAVTSVCAMETDGRFELATLDV